MGLSRNGDKKKPILISCYPWYTYEGERSGMELCLSLKIPAPEDVSF